jgi:hypothetical protein
MADQVSPARPEPSALACLPGSELGNGIARQPCLMCEILKNPTKVFEFVWTAFFDLAIICPDN